MSVLQRQMYIHMQKKGILLTDGSESNKKVHVPLYDDKHTYIYVLISPWLLCFHGYHITLVTTFPLAIMCYYILLTILQRYFCYLGNQVTRSYCVTMVTMFLLVTGKRRIQSSHEYYYAA